ncbi:MAG TPA: hypothetical protein VK208_03520 [Pyrinomonadaceae bacterium]|nr:hypothetical protein [Pyrinomonadaceae bacterium]
MSNLRPLRFTLTGVGAMNSPRFAPAGLLIDYGGTRVMIDGGPGAITKFKPSAWLVTDERSELIRDIRKVAESRGLRPKLDIFESDGLRIEPRSVIHTNHPTCGYLVHAAGKRIVWAPEFFVFPRWAKEADLIFAEAAGWKRPILFRGGVGGHTSVDQVARDARKNKVKRLVFAHIGRPTIKAIEKGERLEFGEFGTDGDVFRLNHTGTFVKRRSKLR